jgi:hypothetical protein
MPLWLGRRVRFGGVIDLDLNHMKKPVLRIEDKSQPRNIQRADIAPNNGYAMVVDGHFETAFSDEEAAQKAGSELLVNFPMLQVEIYNATTKSQSRLKNRVVTPHQPPYRVRG